MRGCQPGHRDPERGAADVVKAEVLAERDGSGVSAVFAANADLQIVVWRHGLR